MTNESDVWRDSPLRYLGYANELGESFRPIAPRLVVPSYAVAIAYVLGDTLDKGRTAHELAPKDHRRLFALNAAADTLLWQGFASVGIPGFVINRVVAATSFAVSKTLTNPSLVKWTPTCVGLSIIPFIIHPIDSFVDYAMDSTTRVWSKEYLDKVSK